MGKIKTMLYEREIGPGFYNETARIEIEEAIHIHIDDNRLIVDKKRFLKLVELFKEAESKFYELGCPSTTEKMHLLSGVDLEPRIAHNRIAIEQQSNDKIHFHYKDLRIHINEGDLSVFCETFDNAWLSMCENNKQVVPIADLKYHPIVDEYIQWLSEYSEDKAPLRDWQQLKVAMIKARSAVGDYFKRNLGFPKGFPKPIDKKVQREYLYALWSDVCEFDIIFPIVCYKLKDGSLQAINSHRLAMEKFRIHTCCLPNKIEVVVVEKESNWKE